MRKHLSILAGLAAATFAASAATAADLPQRKAPPAAAQSCEWCGFYLGVHLGYGWNEIKSAVLEEAGTFKPDGFLIGGQVGYNWQVGRIVPGVEVDFTYTGRKDTLVETIEGKIDYVASARARLGLALSDGLLLYGTGGLAWAHTALAITGEGTTTAGASHFGWAAGAGVEFKIFSPNWIGRLEYLHYDFSKENYLSVIDARATMDVLRGGLSYRF